MTPLSQLAYDNDRLTYLLTFPSALDDKRVLAWLSSISGNMHVGMSRIFGVPTLVFETVANDQGILHRLRVPSRDAHYVVSHLESLVPGINVAEIADDLSQEWTHGVELGMKQPSRTLSVANVNDFSTSVLTSVQSLREKETVVIQWILTPTVPEAPPHRENNPQSHEWSVRKALFSPTMAGSDEIDDRRRKLETPNMLAVGRVGVAAPHELRAKELAREVLHSFAESKSGRNWITERVIKKDRLNEVINTALTPRLFPAQLNMNELTPFVSWPIGSPYIAGLPQSRTRHMHVNNSVPAGGPGNTVIGVSNVKDRNREIGIEQIERMKHVHVIGPIGVGKTAELTNLIQQDMENGMGVVLIETKGDLFEAALERIPRDRINDVIVWDLDDTDYPVGFNVLRQSSSRSATDELNALITTMYPESGVLTTGPLYHGVHALAEYPLGTFIDLPTLLGPSNDDEKRWRDEMVKNLHNREIRKYWDAYLAKEAKTQDKEAEPLKRRLWQFVSRPEIRNSLGQSESSFYMEDVVKEGKILLVNLNGVRIGQQTASIIGTLIMNSVWNAVRTVKHDKPVILYMDEFQNFVTMPTSPSDMLAQSRSFGLGMVLAHQHTGQLKNELRDAVLANARTKIVFQTTANDAKLMATEYGALVKPEDFMNLQFREAIAKVSTSNGVSQPFTMRTKDVKPPSSNPRLIREMSRAKYGRPVEGVEDAIEARRQAAKKPNTRRPTPGWKPLDDQA